VREREQGGGLRGESPIKQNGMMKEKCGEGAPKRRLRSATRRRRRKGGGGGAGENGRRREEQGF